MTFEALAEKDSIGAVLKEHQKYLAHTPDETLDEHIELVKAYFLTLIQVHGTEPLIDSIILESAEDDAEIADFIKQLFWETVFYHDFGKINENYQRERMENIKAFPIPAQNGIKHYHSILSAFIFLVHKISEVASSGLSEDKQKKLLPLICAFAHNILRHHASALDDFSEGRTFQKITNELCDQLKKYLDNYNHSFIEELLSSLPNISETVTFDNKSFIDFAIIRLNFSLLTAADYYATSHFYGKWKELYSSFGVLSSLEKKQVIDNLKLLQPHNANLYQKLSYFANLDLKGLQSKSYENLNLLRSRMAAEVVNNIQSNISERLFYIEAPTGGGKTNLSMIAVSELLQAHKEINKVFYVFPFTTLITQTKKSVKETLGITDDQLIEQHSKAGIKEKEIKEEEQDGLYGKESLDAIHNQFVNYPFTLLTHIKFFDILKANRKDNIYLMHRLANSIVIIDEVQSYNPVLWDKMAYLLKHYADTLNIRCIVMSATLPKIGRLADAEFIYLLPNAIENYFVNPNFSERVAFDDSLMKTAIPSKETKDEYLQTLVQKILERAEEYREKYQKVRVIVEFIFKKSASTFAKLANDYFKEYEVLVLSGTILEPRRKEIINYLKNPENDHKNILLITTQVVEAGVDIDMDLGFKDCSLIDSEEQLAGRVNRNVKKKDCKVYLFNMDDANVIYGNDLRFKKMREHLNENYLDILQSKRFDQLYEQVNEWLTKSNEDIYTAGNLYSYEHKAIGRFNFPKVDQEFQLITQQNTTVFVPFDLPSFILGQDGTVEPVFNKQEKSFLEGVNIAVEETVSGEKVFNLYKYIVTNRDLEYTYKHRQLKILQGIMSQFCFSLFSESKLLKELIAGGNREEYGYLYLATHDQVYDIELGLLDDQFEALIFL